MKYMGSKRRIAKHILPIMLKEAEKHGINTLVEPFVGGGNMIDKVPSSFKRIGYDLNDHAIHAMIGIRDHLDDIPTTVSEEYYKSIRGKEPHHIDSWIRIACSFGGKLDSGYARGGGRNHVLEALKNATKQSPFIQNIDFMCDSYEKLSLSNCLIYCDPPYKNTTGYKTTYFDHDKFYSWCIEQSKNNIVFISEYDMPSEFTEVWRGEIKTNFASNRTKATHEAVEKLYIVNRG